MANLEHLRILRQGVETWNRWRTDHLEIFPDLSDADLTGTEINRANLGSANLSGANLLQAHLRQVDLSRATLAGANIKWTALSEAIFTRADLSAADLSGADMHEANLFEANLSGASLRGAELVGAQLSGATLIGADFSDADLSGAWVGNTVFGDLDLREVKGLETVFHQGPSIIGIDTVYRSLGKIPQVFLRGAGVPDNFIDYMASLVGTAFEYYSCFISYSGKDQEFASRIHADLQDNGVRCWFAPHDVRGGKKLYEQIDAAIRVHERLLLILSPESISSEWVKTEIAKARRREVKEGKRVLFPIRLNISFEQLRNWECFDADTGKDSAREIREYYLPDFTQWKSHDAYQQELKRLLQDFKKSEPASM